MARDRILLSDLEVACVVGIYPHERAAEQPLIVGLELDVDLAAAGVSGRLADTFDYAAIAGRVAAMLQFRRYHLLEPAAHELAAMLLAVHPRAAAVRLRLVKPGAVPAARGAGVEVVRARADFPHLRVDAARAAVVLETAEAGLYLLDPDPERIFDRDVLAWAVGEGAPLRWPRGRPAPAAGALFCCAAPGGLFGHVPSDMS